jgi:hypothetical protein
MTQTANLQSGRSRWSLKIGRPWDLLVFVGAPLAVVLMHIIAVGISLADILVSLDFIIYMVLAFAIAGVVVFGRMSWLDGRVSGKLSPAGLFVLLTCLFVIPILDSFRLKLTNGTFMFGFVPWADAESYVPGGWQMLVDGTLSDWHQRRPINASTMELRLLLSGFNLHILVLLNSVMVAAAATYATLEVEKHMGMLAAAALVVAVFGYVQPYMPSTLSEVLGITLGLVAFATLMRSCRLASVWLYAIGLGLLSFALNARAGTYFVLPAIWLWGVIYLGKTLRQRLTVGALGALGLISGFVYSLLLIKVFGSGEPLSYNANFADTFYGLARGGIGYYSAQNEHPELNIGVDAAQRAAALYKYSFQEIAKYPLRFVRGLLGEIGDALPFLFGGPHLRMIDGYSPATVFVEPFKLVNLVGLLATLRFAFDRRNALILLVLAGFFSSIPFIWHDGGVRVLVATIPFVLFLLSYGLRVIGLSFEGAGWLGIRAFLTSSAPPNLANERTLAIAPASVLLGVALVPFILHSKASSLSADVPAKAGAQCPAGMRYLRFDHNRLTYVMRVHAGDAQFIGSMHDMSHGELQATLSYFASS